MVYKVFACFSDANLKTRKEKNLYGKVGIMQKNNHGKIKFYTMAEVATLLRLSYSTVVRLAKSGEIRSYKIGGRRLFKEEDVSEFLEKRVD